MPSLEKGSNRIVIAGASSLLGTELRSLLEESRFAGAEFRLVDEEIAAGVLTEAGGEPAIIQPVEEGTFDRAAKVFFTGSADFTRANLAAARAAKAKVIDLSGAIAAESETVSWFPKLDSLHARNFPKDASVYAIPSAAAAATASLALGLFKKKKKSVLKRAAQSHQRAEVNRANRTRVRTLMRRLRTAITAGDATAAGNLLHPTMSAIDQAITKGVLHENTGNRYKSRLTLAFNGVKAKAAH